MYCGGGGIRCDGETSGHGTQRRCRKRIRTSPTSCSWKRTKSGCGRTRAPRTTAASINLGSVYALEMALLAPFRAMTARGLRVNDALRRDRLAALTEEAARLATEAQPIVEGVLDRLARRDLVEWWTVCKVCHNGKNKHLSCEACGMFGTRA